MRIDHLIQLDLSVLDAQPNKELITFIKPDFQAEGEDTRKALMHRLIRSKKFSVLEADVNEQEDEQTRTMNNYT